MNDQEKILRYLAISGVEWEMRGGKANDISAVAGRHRDGGVVSIVQVPGKTAFGFVAPKATVSVSNDDILAIACARAAEDNIIAAIKSFSEHPLYSGAKNTAVPMNGKWKMENRKCLLLVITDMPSASDDASGQILSGVEGELFDKMIGAIGLSRDDISITPLCFWRPAGGRSLSEFELAACRPFVDRIISEAAPEKILLLGTVAAREIVGAILPRDNGKECRLQSSECKCVPTYKPDFILANPSVKRDVWEALKSIK